MSERERERELVNLIRKSLILFLRKPKLILNEKSYAMGNARTSQPYNLTHTGLITMWDWKEGVVGGGMGGGGGGGMFSSYDALTVTCSGASASSN